MKHQGTNTREQLKSAISSTIHSHPDPCGSPGMLSSSHTHLSSHEILMSVYDAHSNRALRHWTIHRAWKLYQTQQRSAYYQQLSAQYHSMNAACEALRLCDADGLTAAERDRLGAPPADAVAGEKDSTGRLYRIAMLKKEIWAGVPIEYARIQTESPGKEPWNHAWTR